MKLITAILALIVVTNLACRSSVENGQTAPVAQTLANANSNQQVKTETEQSDPSRFDAQNAKFRIVPDDFKGVDFRNFPYPYKFFNGKRTNIVLTDGGFEYDFDGDRGWFDFKDVFTSS